MYIDVNDYLTKFILNNTILNSLEKLQLPNIEINTESIQVMIINEVTPNNPDDYFYSLSEHPDYMKTTISFFRSAGAYVNNIQDVINIGVYITTAVKSPKTGYSVDSSEIKAHLPILEQELNLFPNLKVIMLMGDVAKKAFNLFTKKNLSKNIIPSQPTYKIRRNEYFYKNIRVIPSYIMTGKNIAIEKSKATMVIEDISKMLDIINN